MKAKLGNVFMGLGILLLLGALALFAFNQWEAQKAEESVKSLMPQLVERIRQRDAASEGDLPQEETTVPEATAETIVPGTPPELLEPEQLVMTEVEIDGNLYIGYLSIPAIELELPVISGWDYYKLKVAPCRYSGTLRGDDLVIMAHNYVGHFRELSQVKVGDAVLFVDMDGGVTEYQVVALDILSPTDVEEMTAGAYDLTLFTCTVGGRSRVTVYCDKAE